MRIGAVGMNDVNDISYQGLKKAEDVKQPEKVNKIDDIPKPENKKNPIDEYVPGDPIKGLYHPGKDEEGNPTIDFIDPNKPDDKSHAANSSKEATKSDKTTTDTDKVDREIKKLKDKKAQLEQQINTEQDEEKKKELETKLGQVEMELLQKDNDTYRRQNAVVH